MNRQLPRCKALYRPDLLYNTPEEHTMTGDNTDIETFARGAVVRAQRD